MVCISEFKANFLIFGRFCLFLSRIYWSSLDQDLMASIWEKAISILAGNLNSFRSYQYCNCTYLIFCFYSHVISILESCTYWNEFSDLAWKKFLESLQLYLRQFAKNSSTHCNSCTKRHSLWPELPNLVQKYVICKWRSFRPAPYFFADQRIQDFVTFSLASILFGQFDTKMLTVYRMLVGIF